MGSPIIPVSLFRSKHDTGYSKRRDQANFYCGINNPVPWSAFSTCLADFSLIEFATKEAAPLFSPTVYLCRRIPGKQGYWCKANGTTSGMAVIDADVGLRFDDAVKTLTDCQLEAVCYTTASNQSGDRFRIVVPLTEPVDSAVHTQVVVAICRFLAPAWKPDTSKNYSYMKFYIPGTYRGADNHFVHLRGDILPAWGWIELGGSPEMPKAKANQTRRATFDPANSNAFATRSLGVAEADWSLNTHCEDYISDYLSMGANRYNGLFSTLVRVAMRAINNGYYLNVSELAAFGEMLYSSNPGKSTHPNISEEAANALDYAESNASPPTPRKSRWPEGYGPQSLDELIASAAEANAPPTVPPRKGPKTLTEYISSLSEGK